MTYTNLRKIHLLALFFIAILAFVPSLWTGFLSDDYLIIYRGLQKINNPTFFRPGPIWLNKAWFGTHALLYHSVNIILHVFTCMMFYLLTEMLVSLRLKQQNHIAFMSAVLFAVYPYHLESVVWISGVASIGAGGFIVSSLYFLFLDIKRNHWIFFALSLISFFFALLFYESSWCLLFFPFVLFLYFPRSQKKILFWLLGVLAVFACFLYIKFVSIGTIWGVYGLESNTLTIVPNSLLNVLKFVMRSITPPIHNKTIYLILFSIFFISVAIGILLAIKKSKEYMSWFLMLIILFLISLIPVVNLGISSFTHESERFLYLPSVWICILLSSLLALFNKKYLLVLLCIGSLVYGYMHQLKMRQISNKCETLVSNLTKKLDPIHKLVVMDYPGTIEGIYAFRHGFSESICLLNPSFKNSNFSMASMKDFSRFPDYEISRWNDSTTIRFKEIK